MPNRLHKTSTEQAKVVIEALVKDYIAIFPDEYLQFKNSVRDKREIQLNKYSEIQGSDVITRELGEYPITLYNLFLTRLEADQLEYLRSLKGSRWFFTRFPTFAIANLI